jgi:Ca2+-binding EF-hand superfamily protein
MRNKYTVIDLISNTTKQYKSLRCVAKAYSNIDYHQIYQIYKQTIGRTNRRQQTNNDIYKLYQYLKIYDNDLDGNIIKPLHELQLAPSSGNAVSVTFD